MPYMPPKQAVDAMEVIRRAAKEAGRDANEITFGYNVGVKIAEGATSSRAVAGTSDEVSGKVRELLDLGFGAINFWVGGDRERQFERLSGEVIPQLR
jgi:alkanesulfonate monooxygenase SsuD/methylene tetrahydromethanopterin reductase-like flavin-dependent oxidoreductase (luciferase family)